MNAVTKKGALADAICKQAHITRKRRGSPALSKRELLLLHSYLILVNDLQQPVPAGAAPADGVVQ